MTNIRPAVLFLALLQQGTPPGSREALDWVQLAERCFGGAEVRQAQVELARQVERDYAGAFAAWRKAPDGRTKEMLEHVLALPAARAAALVLAGRVQRVEAIQGGVIDHHTLLVTFGALEVLRATGSHAGDLRAATLGVLRGTNTDAWLADQLRQNLERVAGDRVWLFTSQELRRPVPGGGEGRAVTILEWTTLPAAAAPCLREMFR